jgi:hypothetical protein
MSRRMKHPEHVCGFRPHDWLVKSPEKRALQSHGSHGTSHFYPIMIVRTQ